MIHVRNRYTGYDMVKGAVAGQDERELYKQPTQYNLPGIKGNLLGAAGRNIPFCILKSIGFMLDTTTFIRTSSLLGVGTGASTC